MPSIKRANQCKTMVLHARIEQPGWRFWTRPEMKITATCVEGGDVRDPMIGCGQCHSPLTFVVYQDPDQDDAKERAA